jgi:hypothetical protein
MDTKQAVQERKAERVQEELRAEPVLLRELLYSDPADEPCWISLKAERVQLPAILADERPQQLSSTIQLTVSPKQPMTIETVGTVIRLLGATADTSAPEGGSGLSGAGQPKAA